MIKLIASDMDGTLLDEFDRLPPDFFEVLDEINKNKIHFVVASGRSYITLYDNFTPKSEELFYIADNGSCIVENGKITYKNVLSHENIKEIINICKSIKNVELLLCGIKGAYILGSSLFVNEVKKYYNYRNAFVVNNLNDINDDIFKISIYDPLGPLENSNKIIYPLFKDKLTIVPSAPLWLTIMNLGANKGDALLKMQQKLSISPEETMVFGDFYNDIEMFKHAHYSFAMNNATDEMKKYANFVADSNREYGVTKAIKKHIFNHK